MRKEVELWIKQAEYDFGSAMVSYENERWSTCAFLVQQAVEKGLKALFLHEKNGIIPQTHSLIYLAKNTSISGIFDKFLRNLTPKFIDTRYPDASIGAPFELYEKEDCTELVENGKKVLEWIRKKL